MCVCVCVCVCVKSVGTNKTPSAVRLHRFFVPFVSLSQAGASACVPAENYPIVCTVSNDADTPWTGQVSLAIDTIGSSRSAQPDQVNDSRASGPSQVNDAKTSGPSQVKSHPIKSSPSASPLWSKTFSVGPVASGHSVRFFLLNSSAETVPACTNDAAPCWL